jgi:pyruvate dehydrogenase E2 component (dihydrolipoamide acetyltransferase)
MKSFALPDLGEGLREAEIVAWHVAEGDHVVADQPLVSVETEKAVVEIPSPQSGRIAQLLARPGEIVNVGAPIATFEEGARFDIGAVVGELAERPPAQPAPPADGGILASPAVRALARERGVDLGRIVGSGPGGAVLRLDVERATASQGAAAAGEPLKGIRRAMAVNMARAHAEVAPATLWDQADIERWWSAQADVSIRVIRAIAIACVAEPALNARYEGKSMVRQQPLQVDLGIAVDIDEGLIVPVLRDIGNRSMASLRQGLNALKTAARARTVGLADLRGPTITFSNFGLMAGRHAALVVLPPQVAIIGIGRIAPEAALRPEGLSFPHMLPLSLTFDHRAVTGGEAARFLKAMIGDLQEQT